MSGHEPPRVFLSYSSKDKSQVRRLAHDLEHAGIDIWFDEFVLRAGDPILSSIRTAIENAQHLIVVISQNSLSSTWVDRELRAAFIKHGAKGSPTIIPVRIDDSEIPEFLRSIKYVDLRANYEDGLSELVEAVKAAEGERRVADVIDPSDLAEDLAKDRKALRGPGFYVSTLLTIVTIIATIVAAWPAFHQAFGDRAKVYYSVKQSQMSIPASLDQERIRTMLKTEGIPDSSLKVSVINRGAREADEIKIGVGVSGSLSTFLSKPDSSTDPVWVTIEPPEIKADTSSANLGLQGLIPNRVVTSTFSYFGEGPEFSCDVVADGLLAEEVEDVSSVPQWSVWQAVQTPVIILLVGIFLSIIGGTIVASINNKKFRDLAIDILDVVYPSIARFLKSIY